MKKTIFSLVTVSILTVIGVSLLVYLSVQTIILAVSSNKEANSCPWYGFLPALALVALFAIPLIAMVCIEGFAIRKSYLSHTPISESNKEVFWLSIACLAVLLATYLFQALTYAAGEHVWFSLIGSTEGLIIFSLIVHLLAIFFVWNCFSFNPYRKEINRK